MLKSRLGRKLLCYVLSRMAAMQTLHWRADDLQRPIV